MRARMRSATMFQLWLRTTISRLVPSAAPIKAHNAVRAPAIASMRCAACVTDDELTGIINAVVASSTMNCMSRGVATRHSRWLTTEISATLRKKHSLKAFGSHERHSSWMMAVQEIFSSSTVGFATIGSGVALGGICSLG